MFRGGLAGDHHHEHLYLGGLVAGGLRLSSHIGAYQRTAVVAGHHPRLGTLPGLQRGSDLRWPDITHQVAPPLCDRILALQYGCAERVELHHDGSDRRARWVGLVHGGGAHCHEHPDLLPSIVLACCPPRARRPPHYREDVPASWRGAHRLVPPVRDQLQHLFLRLGRGPVDRPAALRPCLPRAVHPRVAGTEEGLSHAVRDAQGP
mmetsp:Transcript_42194/g.117494  ORF Transcript_42194/g.117494 Transcript_42194/m.117494 type:complete len:206 (-) Transcript_42194:243-860(-)